MIDIAIGICVYNRQDLIYKQIEYIENSLKNANFSYSVIIYDDYSDIPIKIKKTAYSIILERGIENVGLIEARNKLVDLSKSNHKNIIFLDDDIFVYNLNDAIEKSLCWLAEKYCCVSIPYINLPIEYRGGLSWFKYVFDFRRYYDEVVFFNGGSSIFRLDVFHNFGELEGKYRMYLEEEDLALRIFAGGGKIKCAVGENFVSIHDQPRGKKIYERGVFLLSNRMLFHKKFIRSMPLRYFLNLSYCFFYLIKKRNLKIVNESIGRYFAMKDNFKSENIKTSVFIRFMMRRFFNA